MQCTQIPYIHTAYVHGVTDFCQNGSIRGRAFATFKRRFSTNQTTNQASSFFFNAVIICFIPFLWIRPAMRLRLMSPLSSAHWLQVLHRLTLIGVNALMSQSAYNYHVVHLSQCNTMICTQYHRNGSM